jgi:transposase InsO family protein
MDFIGPFVVSSGFDTILTITCRLTSRVRVLPMRATDTAEAVAALFFDQWVCAGMGIPQEIVSDRDKLFVSKFWQATQKLLGTEIRMSTAYHPQTDGASKRTNKTVNQLLQYHVDRNQKGWHLALPRIEFAINDTQIASTGKGPFELTLGYCP